ncbi:MAG: NAD(P)-dependent oxidoreductase, partial [Candidatus Thorarchaeota archaeon]|nr:NAD(P)-dependent oxidoreductase [Candidatus Thorarchaeota archaeon]
RDVSLVIVTVQGIRMPVNVLFIWDVREELRKYLEKGLADVADLNLIFPSPAEEEEYMKHIESANIIVGWRPSHELLDKAESLDLFINPGAGIQHHLDYFRELAKKREVVLANGHGNSYFTAQHVVALLLALTNKVIPHHNWMTDGKWRMGDKDAKSTPLRNRKVGLLGYGAINRKVHKFLSGFDVEFHILKRSWEGREEIPKHTKKYTPEELHSFLEEIDVLVNAIPHTSETEGLIGSKELELLGRDGLLVNIGRGATFDQEALFNALASKSIAGAAIDVWYEYRPEENKDGRKYPYTKQFHELDNVVLSPHRGASPMDDLHRWDEVVENITRYSKGQRNFLNQVDLERGY